MKRRVGVEVGVEVEVHRYCCCCWRVVAGSWLREDRGDGAGVAYYYSFPMLIRTTGRMGDSTYLCIFVFEVSVYRMKLREFVTKDKRSLLPHSLAFQTVRTATSRM